MNATQATERIQTEANDELRRAVRDFPSVDVVGTGDRQLTLRGEQEAIRQIRRALWTRQLSARDFGQDSLAAADASARAQIERAT